MSGLEDEKLTVQLRGLRRQDPPPRQEFVTYLDQTLVKQARQIKKRQKVSRILSMTGGAAAAVVLALLVAVPDGKEVPDGTSSVRTEQRAENAPSLAKEKEIPEQSNIPPVAEQRKTSQVKEQPKQKEQSIITKSQPLPKSRTQPKTATTVSNAPTLPVEQYIKQKLGDKSKQYQLASNHQEKDTAVFQRVINGIPFADSVVKVPLESDGRPAGMVIEENLDAATDLSIFPSPAKAISKEEAVQRLTASLKQEEVATFAGYINALSGEVLDRHFQSVAAARSYSLIPIQAQGKLLVASSEEEIASLIQEEFGVRIGGENRPLSTEQHEAYMEYTWKMTDDTYLTARFASKSGQLLAYRMKNKTESDTSAELSQAQAAEIGAKKLASYLPRQITQLAIEGAAVEDSAIRLDFIAITQGARVESHKYKVWVDSTSKQVVGLEGNFSEIGESSTESNKGNSPSLELLYVWPEVNGKRTPAPYLVYQVKQ
ncbi:YcdB/YcdC domain-containing protein [Brevibacillus sp. 179-C9.3 HS]|uniref:YcdB/YcdC domain-containing protein n=1 Tax=unclassified Brevibacillus TaxID=2684853 RepID=UPI00399EED64